MTEEKTTAGFEKRSLKIAKSILKKVRSEGYQEISPGVYIESKESIIATVKESGENPKEYKTCKYWVTTSDGVGPAGYDTAEELADFILSIFYDEWIIDFKYQD